MLSHRNRPVAEALQVAQHQDLHQMARVKAGGRAVIADIAGDNPLVQTLVQRLNIRTLGDEAPVVEVGEKLGLVARHGLGALYEAKGSPRRG